LLEPQFVFRPGTKGRKVLFLFFHLCFFSLLACGAGSVAGVPRKEAAERLKQGDVRFILSAAPGQMEELTRIHPSAAFYAGLLLRPAASWIGSEPGEELSKAILLAEALFEASLKSPSPRVREEAARELIAPVLERKATARRVLNRLQQTKAPPGTDPSLVSLRGAVLYSLGRFEEIEALYAAGTAQSSWDRVIRPLAALGVKDQAPAVRERAIRELGGFFLSGEPGAAYRWALEQTAKQEPPFFTDAENAAIAGRLAVSRSSFAEGLKAFLMVPEQERALFFQYPELITDLGRAFQFTNTANEGSLLFLEWDGFLEAALAGRNIPEPGAGMTAVFQKPADPARLRKLRYLLLYFAARIERQRERYTQAAELFNRALDIAPDPVQGDACIWYILSIALADKTESAAALTMAYLPRWDSPAYFADILDRLSRNLTAARQWKTMGDIFSLLRSRSDGASIAQYAYILGRAVSLGYMPPEDAAACLGLSGSPGEGKIPPREELAQAFFRIAFEEGNASFYYRALSASYLGDAVAPIPEGPLGKNKKSPSQGEIFPHKEEMEFLLNFFEFGAASFVLPYFQNKTREFSTAELRALAEALAASGRWNESIRIIAHYMSREDYKITLTDMELYYPRPFQELIEDKARTMGIGTEIFYGLIRTESSFMPDIVSHAGARGLTQLMPATAGDMAGRIARQGGPDFGKDGDLLNPELNLHIGAFYLNYLIEKMGSPLMALLAYNGGMGRVRRWRLEEARFPEDLFLETIEYTETREYGRRVLAAAAAYGYLYYGMSMEAVVADIFK
jgi:soluble lytic murein transglycosylase